MALKKTITTKHGAVINEAYIRVERVSLTSKVEISCSIRIYADPSKPFIDERAISVPYELDGSNPIQQAYVYVKTLPKFSNAEDC